MNTQTFKELKQVLKENDYCNNGDKWGAAMGLFFDVAAFVYEDSNTPKEWQYKPGAMGNYIDTDSCNYEWINSLDEDTRKDIGKYLHRLTNILDKKGFSY